MGSSSRRKVCEKTIEATVKEVTDNDVDRKKIKTENKIETPLGRKTRSSSRRKVEPAVKECDIDVQIEQLTDSDLEIEEVTNMYEEQNQKVKRDGSEQPFSL